MNRLIFVIIIVALGVVPGIVPGLTPLVATSLWAQTSTATKEPVGEPAETKEPAPAPETDLVVARVSGDPITEKQVLAAIEELSRQRRLPLAQMNQRNSLFFNDAINNLITLSLLKKQIRDRNIGVDDAAVERQLRQMAQNFPSPEAFQKALAAQGMTEAELRNNIRESAKLQKIIDEATSGVAPVTEADIARFYTDNPNKFTLPERVHAAQIFLAFPDDATPAQKAAIKQKLDSIRIEIEAETITFSAAARKYSEDKNTADKGGDMGWLARTGLPPSFADALFSAKPETLTAALESDTGYHLMKILAVKAAGPATLDEARSSIRQYLEQNANVAARQKFMAELERQATIENFMSAEEFARRHPVEQIPGLPGVK